MLHWEVRASNVMRPRDVRRDWGFPTCYATGVRLGWEGIQPNAFGKRGIKPSLPSHVTLLFALAHGVDTVTFIAESNLPPPSLAHPLSPASFPYLGFPSISLSRSACKTSCSVLVGFPRLVSFFLFQQP